MATMKELKAALVAAHEAGDTANAAKLADAIRNAQAVTPRSEQELQKEYDSSPWYSKLGTSADDMARLAASGITFGQLDKWLGPEEAKKTAEARTRAGLAGDVAEIGGSVMSPVTQGVGVLGNAATRVVPGLLSRIGVAGAEGGALGAFDAWMKGKDVKDSATTGAAISAAIPIAGKVIGRASSFLQGTDPKSLSTAFQTGKEGGTVSNSFRRGQAELPIDAAKEQFANAERGWRSRAPVRPQRVLDEFRNIRRESTTSASMSKLTPEDQRAFEQMNTMIQRMRRRGSTVENMDALRRQIDSFAGGGEVQSMMATRLKNAIRESVEGVNPGYTRDLGRYSRSKDAQAAGRDLAGMFPKGSLLGHLAQTVATGSALTGSLLLHPAMTAMIPMFSPRLSGKIANATGEAVGRARTTSGAAVPAWNTYQEQKAREVKKRKKKDREILEITIPGGGL